MQYKYMYIDNPEIYTSHFSIVFFSFFFSVHAILVQYYISDIVIKCFYAENCL